MTNSNNSTKNDNFRLHQVSEYADSAFFGSLYCACANFHVSLEKLKMPYGGVTVKDVCPHQFVKALSVWLKKSTKVKLPEYVDYVKTGRHKELAPYDKDWYYVRAASVVRHIYLRPSVGVGGLRKVYGGRKRRGTVPATYVKASASIHRNILQQLEKMQLIEADSENGGRRITSRGQKDLDQIAGQVMADKQKK